MIVDGTMEEAITGEAKVLFSQLGANPNNTDSVRMLGDNIFGFEQIWSSFECCLLRNSQAGAQE